jgi:hypothetical protein
MMTFTFACGRREEAQRLSNLLFQTSRPAPLLLIAGKEIELTAASEALNF